MTPVAASEFPLWSVFGTILVFFGMALVVWLWITVFRDLFQRDDVSAWRKTAWVLLVMVLPIVGSLVYLVSQSRAMGERRLGEDGATQLRMDAYVRSASGGGAYRGIRDVTETREVMTTPMRPS